MTKLEILSEDKLVNELAKQPSTFSWDTIAEYDRPKTNMVLAHEYIERYSKNNHLDPLTDAIEIVQGQYWEYVENYILDAPRLSFEHSSIVDSEAHLSMEIIGGQQLSISRKSANVYLIDKVEMLDPLTSQSLAAQLRLNRTAGQITDEGRVFLDLKDALAVKLLFPGSDVAQGLGGNAIKKYFENLPDEKRIYVLNELGKPEMNEFLVPDRFDIRVHLKTQANTPTGVYESEGAVALFVAMKDNKGGTSIPSDDDQMKYLIPAGRSATILLGHHFLIRQVIAKGLEKASNNSKFEYDLENDENMDAPVGLLTARNGGRYGESIHGTIGSATVSIQTPTLHFNNNSDNNHFFTVAVENEEFHIRWRGRQHLLTKIQVSSWVREQNVFAIWDIEKTYKFVLVDGALGLVSTATPKYLRKVSPGEFGDFPGINFAVISPFIESELDEIFRKTFEDFVAPISEIDLFRLYGILFRNSHDEAISLDRVRFPMDLALFGQISPRLTAFQINPLDSVVASGSESSFTLTPPQKNAVWSVANVPGHEGPTGSIDTAGFYTAPLANEIRGAFTRVLVKAAVGETSSSALIKVTRRNIAINPAVVNSHIGGPPIKISADAVSGAELDWSIKTGTGASLIVDEDGVHWYRPGSRSISNHVYEKDTVTVKNISTNESIFCTIIVYQPPDENSAPADIIFDTNLSDGKLHLDIAAFAGIPVDNQKFEVFAGSGTIDGNGIYTPDLNSPDRFTAIVGTGTILDSFPIASRAIITIPYVNPKELIIPNAWTEVSK
ncbi:hypothetical protein [Mesorhizobium sp. NBSH29]|uniref:hypothetical protein n=1 Tax=Mesorhizobium sp. NBSH29 TaxID=2654249 RepID=UPI00189656AB|nr:hypothetical protein [Mesorhizobium sp. NBSH29]